MFEVPLRSWHLTILFVLLLATLRLAFRDPATECVGANVQASKHSIVSAPVQIRSIEVEHKQQGLCTFRLYL